MIAMNCEFEPSKLKREHAIGFGNHCKIKTTPTIWISCVVWKLKHTEQKKEVQSKQGCLSFDETIKKNKNKKKQNQQQQKTRS